MSECAKMWAGFILKGAGASPGVIRRMGSASRSRGYWIRSLPGIGRSWRMVGEWLQVMLAKVLSFSNGKSSPDRADDLPHPVYGSNGIIGFAEETNADPDTIVIGRVGSYCGSLYFSKHKCWVTDNVIQANAIGDNDARFLFYLLKTLDLNHWRSGSGQPLLNQTILGAIPASVPEPIEQRAIAHIFGALDDKIELNRKMNETLEAMARAIFKSWFVDFDPIFILFGKAMEGLRECWLL